MRSAHLWGQAEKGFFFIGRRKEGYEELGVGQWDKGWSECFFVVIPFSGAVLQDSLLCIPMLKGGPLLRDLGEGEEPESTLVKSS